MRSRGERYAEYLKFKYYATHESAGEKKRRARKKGSLAHFPAFSFFFHSVHALCMGLHEILTETAASAEHSEPPKLHPPLIHLVLFRTVPWDNFCKLRSSFYSYRLYRHFRTFSAPCTAVYGASIDYHASPRLFHSLKPLPFDLIDC